MSITPEDETDLNAWVDNALVGQDRERIRKRLEADSALKRHAEELQAQRLGLQALGAEVLSEAIPARLLAAAQKNNGQAWGRGKRWLMAASVVAFTFCLGWWGRGQTFPEIAPSGVRSAAFARDAVIAHAVYTPEIKHPVEVSADQQVHLVQWLSKRLGSQLHAPELQSQGFGLVGGRLLPGGEGARAQLMYQNEKGERVTLYVARLDGAAPVEPSFRIETIRGVSAFYWAEGSQAYALSGQMDRAALLVLAEAIYHQLQH
jgi:anti-sigma factor RsiW